MGDSTRPTGFRDKLFDVPCQAFINHMDRMGNSRILFSGKFGMGKTYFLDHFFKETTQKEKLRTVKYRAIHLFPVNYSISSTEDIFSYLKYDILVKFLEAGIELEKNDFAPSDMLPHYVKSNFPAIVRRLVSFTPKVGNAIEKLMKSYDEILEDLTNRVEKYKQDEEDIFDAFMQRIEDMSGSIYENDLLTKIISSVLRRLKDETKYENVLVIDDLDRIDPEHVFRILNVFAAHLDTKEGIANKLGFEKVILVCDILNLQSIFKTRYGVSSDFNGYIDKFYSNEVFRFDNRKIVSDIAYEAARAVEFIPSGNMGPGYFESIYFNEKTLATEFLTHLIQFGYINLRSLINRINCNPVSKGIIRVEFLGGFSVPSLQYPLLFNMSILGQLAGGYRSLREHIRMIPVYSWQIGRLDYYCNQMLCYIYLEKISESKGEVFVDFNQKNLKITATLEQVRSSQFRVTQNGKEPQIQYNFTAAEFLMLADVFIDTLEMAKYEI